MGVLNSSNLLWGLSIAVLLAIYLRSRSHPTIDVSSLLLFDEAAAPSARVRTLRIDPLFWLEAAALGALALALAGLYVRTAPTATQGRSRALVFDLAAAMGAHEGSATRLDLAKSAALEIVDAAATRDRFSVVGYALEAEMIHPETANRDSIRQAILSMHSLAVPTNQAAAASALMRARAAGEVDWFADRKPPDAIVAASGLAAHFHFHPSGRAAENLAIVSLDPGIPKSSPGRAVLKNLGTKPHTCELVIDSDNKNIFHQTLILSPHEQVVVPFGPLASGGLVHAGILSRDALEADNNRYAFAPMEVASRVLVLSPDASARDDIARVLLAVKSNFIISTADPAKFSGANEYALAVMHDCYVPTVNAQSILLMFPPLSMGQSNNHFPGLRVVGTVPGAQLSRKERANSTPTQLASTRKVSIPEWMTLKASGSGVGVREIIPLAAIGSIPAGRFGVVAFDIRDHLLLDPDRLDALLTTVDLIRELTAPQQLQIVSSGAFLAIAAPSGAKVVAPDGTTLASSPDHWGRLRIRPTQAGHYAIESATAGTIDVYSNYYDATESDLSADASSRSSQTTKTNAVTNARGPKQVQPVSALLVIFATLAIIFESALLLRNANRWGMRHV